MSFLCLMSAERDKKILIIIALFIIYTDNILV